MILKNAQNQRAIPGDAKKARIFFFCGPNEAGATDMAQRIIADLPDAGERIELTGAQIRSDAALLGDEARSDSLFSGSRHVLVRASGDEALDALRALIETGDAGAGDAAPVFIIATSATEKSRTAKLLEKRSDALVAVFQPPSPGDLARSVRAMADAAGLRLANGVAERIAHGAGLDVRLAQAEIDKLAIYCDASPQTPKQASLADHDLIGAATEDDGFQPLVNTVLGGDLAKLPQELKRCREMRLNPIGVALALERRASLLVKLAGEIGPRSRVGSLSFPDKMRLGVFIKEEADIDRQLSLWRLPVGAGSGARRLDRLVSRLVALHSSLLANSQSADLMLASELTEIARFASRR